MAKRQSVAAPTPNAAGVLDAIEKRHSVRSFARQPVDKATIRALLHAAVRAPTAMHEEPWAFVIIQDQTTLERLSDAAKDMMAKKGPRSADANRPSRLTPAENIFYDAGTLIVICGKPMGHFVVADCWLAAENLMLAACALGLGTCVIGLAVPALNSPGWKTELGIAPETTAYAPIIVGAPAARGAPGSRREPEVLSWR